MRDSWYYAVPEGQIGPITLQELKETLPTLPNAKDVYIWHDSLPDWIRAGDLADIVANAKSAVPQPQHAGADDGASEAASAEPSTKEAEWEPQSAEEADWNPESLGDFHPDPSVAINAPSIVTAGPAIADEPEVVAEDVKPRAWRAFFIGVLVMLLACALVYGGITGRAAWSGLLLHRDNRLIDAAPGAVLLLVGLFLAWGSLRKSTS
jgi:GYF domain 2